MQCLTFAGLAYTGFSCSADQVPHSPAAVLFVSVCVAVSTLCSLVRAAARAHRVEFLLCELVPSGPAHVVRPFYSLMLFAAPMCHTRLTQCVLPTRVQMRKCALARRVFSVRVLAVYT